MSDVTKEPAALRVHGPSSEFIVSRQIMFLAWPQNKNPLGFKAGLLGGHSTRPTLPNPTVRNPVVQSKEIFRWSRFNPQQFIFTFKVMLKHCVHWGNS